MLKEECHVSPPTRTFLFFLVWLASQHLVIGDISKSETHRIRSVTPRRSTSNALSASLSSSVSIFDISHHHHDNSDSSHYHVTVTQSLPKPVLSYIDHTSSFRQVLHPSWIPPCQSTNFTQGLLVQGQNCTNMTCPECLGRSDTLYFTRCNPIDGGCDSVTVKQTQLSIDGSSDPPIKSHFLQRMARLQYMDVDNEVYSNPRSLSESDSIAGPQVRHPSVTYSAKYELFFMLRTSLVFDNCTLLSLKLQLLTSTNPTDNASWQLRTTIDVMEMDCLVATTTAVLLISDDLSIHSHMIWYGSTHIYLLTSDSIFDWSDASPQLWLSPHPQSYYFDSIGVQPGAPPIQLAENNSYLFLYNGRQLLNETTMIGIGYLILDGSDPSLIISRSNDAIYLPTLEWESGISPYTCLPSRIAFATAIVSIPNNMTNTTTADYIYRIYFAAGGTNVGTAVIKVSISNNSINWFNYLLIGSIASFVFCIIAFCILRKSPKDAITLDLRLSTTASLTNVYTSASDITSSPTTKKVDSSHPILKDDPSPSIRLQTWDQSTDAPVQRSNSEHQRLLQIERAPNPIASAKRSKSKSKRHISSKLGKFRALLQPASSGNSDYDSDVTSPSAVVDAVDPSTASVDRTADRTALDGSLATSRYTPMRGRTPSSVVSNRVPNSNANGTAINHTTPASSTNHITHFLFSGPTISPPPPNLVDEDILQQQLYNKQVEYYAQSHSERMHRAMEGGSDGTSHPWISPAQLSHEYVMSKQQSSNGVASKRLPKT